MVGRLREARRSAHPVEVGARAEAAITADLLRQGITVLQPCGVNHRYDLVLDLDGTFVRAQCKSGRLRRGAVEFNTVSVRCNTARSIVKGYRGEADIFLVYCQATSRTYAVPVDDVPVGRAILRVDPPNNGQHTGIRWASAYELPA